VKLGAVCLGDVISPSSQSCSAATVLSTFALHCYHPESGSGRGPLAHVKSAKTFGLSIPLSLLTRADEVIKVPLPMAPLRHADEL
jgi:hypothetical protein